MNNVRLKKEAVLRVGEVTEVTGQRIGVRVDRNKNASDLLFDGDVLKNIAVNSYVEIRKGFTSLIGKVEGERLDEIPTREDPAAIHRTDKNRRFLQVSLTGYINQHGGFSGGLHELPLIGNEVFLITKDKIETIYNLVADDRASINFAVTDNEGFDIAFPIDGLFNSHIAIFGNTGSGKSNTLAALYKEFTRTLSERNKKKYHENVRVILFDFNGEYIGKECITPDKHVYELSTRTPRDRLPISEDTLTDVELLSILSDATDKTQKPFLRRTMRLLNSVYSKDDPDRYFRSLLRKNVKLTLQMSDKQRADHLLDYFREILPKTDDDGRATNLRDGIEWHNKVAGFRKRNSDIFYSQSTEDIRSTSIYKMCSSWRRSNDDALSNIITFMYLQLIMDLHADRAHNDHIAPVINRLVARRGDIEKVFDTSGDGNLWNKNFIVVSLHQVNLDMRKTIPLLLAKRLYEDHKQNRGSKSLTFIIDEAHNILSTDSFRESESWKDYRLETFEEIIKEGRKFGVFVTISSQRPNDISPTITSQAHNYFIHRLVNQRDLSAIASAVSYIDSVSESSIPTLPVGTCIFSGVAGQMPLKIRVHPLDKLVQPQSNTLTFEAVVPKRH